MERFSRWLEVWVTGGFRYWFDHPSAPPNGAKLHPRLEVEHLSAITSRHSGQAHNLTTDLIHWRGHFYLVHAASPWHIASPSSRILLWRSRDAKEWELAREFRLEKGDIRDPKLAVINDRLLLYVLRNDGFVAEPGGTYLTWTEDGNGWTPLTPVQAPGWLFWRPKSQDGKTWYVPAYWGAHGRSALFRSEEGIHWELVFLIHEGDHNDETDIEFLPDGKLLATARLEMCGGAFGHPEACTLIALSEPPYQEWKRIRCSVTRLDGPRLFGVGDTVFALGRHFVGPGGWLRHRGSLLGSYRTALYRVGARGLSYLSDLPSTGDTGYPGVAIVGDHVYFSYYTSDVSRDYRWVAGMFLPTEVRVGRMPVRNLSLL